MLECLIVGDSIAVGISQVRPECESVAKVGITSTAWNKQFLTRIIPAKTLIISLGTNDDGVNTEMNVRKLRIKAGSYNVFWVLPNEQLKPKQAAAVIQVAKEFGDVVISNSSVNISADKIHPTSKGYKQLAEKTR
jgi:lysophospholipase L1-like esterase